MILYKTMKGNNSEQNLFKKLPKLSMNGYQGSLSKTFRRNKKNLLEESLQKKIKMKLLICYFLMKWYGWNILNNPLKILHSELENNNDTININHFNVVNNNEKIIDKKITFIGISNYYLDASFIELSWNGRKWFNWNGEKYYWFLFK